MSVVTVSEVVKAFSPAFKSVDLRIVAVVSENQWLNVISSVFLSCKSQEEIKSEQQQVRDKIPKTNEFCIFLACYPFEELYDVFEQFKKGEVRLHRTYETKFREFDPSELRVDRYRPSYLEEMEEWTLVGSEAEGQQEDRKNLWSIVESQNGTARLFGYENIYELIREKLRIREFNRGRTRDFVIGIPILARIVNARFADSSLEVEIKKASSLKDLQLNVSHERASTKRAYYEFVGRGRITSVIKGCKHPPTDTFCSVTDSVNLTNLRPFDRIEVELIHRQAPAISMDKTFLEVPLENAVEPFAKALFSFCAIEEFEKRLFNPEKCQKPDKTFEDAVAWLLSLIGFSVAQLGKKFEKLRVPETKFERGSSDMIAYRENEHLLFVDCDTRIPDEKKIRSMMTVKEYFQGLQEEGRPYILSVIFSPQNCAGFQTDPLTVKIVDRYQIKRIFEEAMKGNTKQARLYLVY